MEDLIPLLIFIAIALINFLKYMSEKGGKIKQPPSNPEGEQLEPPEGQPSTIEEFFEEIAQKFAPQPRELPEWPEDRKRPDYVKEMQEFKRAQADMREEEQKAEIIPLQPKPTSKPAIPPPAIVPLEKMEIPKLRVPGKSAMFRLPVQGNVFGVMQGMRIATPPLLRSATGQLDFDLQDRKKLKQAIIANIIFSSPRAYETSFHNTLAE